MSQRVAYYKRKRGFSTLNVNYHNNNKHLRQKEKNVLCFLSGNKGCLRLVFNFPRLGKRNANVLHSWSRF